jgi:hypothetical protein
VRTPSKADASLLQPAVLTKALEAVSTSGGAGPHGGAGGGSDSGCATPGRNTSVASVTSVPSPSRPVRTAVAPGLGAAAAVPDIAPGERVRTTAAAPAPK